MGSNSLMNVSHYIFYIKLFNVIKPRQNNLKATCVTQCLNVLLLDSKSSLRDTKQLWSLFVPILFNCFFITAHHEHSAFGCFCFTGVGARKVSVPQWAAPTRRLLHWRQDSGDGSNSDSSSTKHNITRLLFGGFFGKKCDHLSVVDSIQKN